MRKTVAACVLSLVTVAPVFGDERTSNTLSNDEIRAGWLLLYDGQSLFGWKTGAVFNYGQLIAGKESAGVRQKDGNIALDHNSAILSTSRFGDAEVHFQYRCSANVISRFFVVGHQQISAALWPRNNGWESQAVKILKDKVIHFQAYDGSTVTTTGSGNKGPKTVGFACGFEGTLQLHAVKLRPLNMKPFFNGTDLTGWKTFPGKKSKFTVADGAINITNGPGDLQTEGKYGDFILQFECKSNGKHLNSGVFFRCREGEYQNGYEAQIRNQFTAEPKQVYTIEEYDPKTHKLIGKNKVKYTAVDYGTGAIYRRQPARREVAKDGEWFIMTVLAHGNHFATWVNGIQVTDWADNRPPSDNARTGFRRAAGHISLQGHDPTTNLSFRNFRIAELNNAKAGK